MQECAGAECPDCRRGPGSGSLEEGWRGDTKCRICERNITNSAKGRRGFDRGNRALSRIRWREVREGRGLAGVPAQIWVNRPWEPAICAAQGSHREHRAQGPGMRARHSERRECGDKTGSATGQRTTGRGPAPASRRPWPHQTWRSDARHDVGSRQAEMHPHRSQSRMLRVPVRRPEPAGWRECAASGNIVHEGETAGDQEARTGSGIIKAS